MLSVPEAQRLLDSILPAGEVEEVALSQAVQRCLARPLIADRDGPPYDRVAMDGYAILHTPGQRSWAVAGLQVAGRPPLSLGGPSEAIEVATGAVLPQGCDTVLPYEDTLRTGPLVSLAPDRPLPPRGRNVHARATDYRGGEVLIPPGTILRSPHLHSLATVGWVRVPVVRRLRWSMAVTGDELVDVASQPEPWQIRRSNAAAITAEAATWGLFPEGETRLPDDPTILKDRFEALTAEVEVLVVTGGVSAGALDLVPGVLGSLGAKTLFHGVAQKPGKPLWCGQLPRASGRPVTLFGLPGNPLSSLFSFRRFVLPWLLRAEGRSAPVASVSVDGLRPAPPGQTSYIPWSPDRGVVPWTGSGDFRALGESSGFLEITDGFQPGESVFFYPWGGPGHRP